MARPPDTSMRCASLHRLHRKHHVEVRERLEFERVAARVQEEHGGLLAGFTLEANIRFNHELRARRLQFFRQRCPLRHGQECAEMAHGDAVSIDGVGCAAARFSRREMRHDLMTVEVEVDPVRSAAAFGATQQTAVEGARLLKAVNRKRNMEGEERGVH
jgi:hypothetical protein